jgi:hypothetical protein
LPVDYKTEFRRLGYDGQSAAPGHGFLKELRAFGGIVDQQAGRHGGKGDEYGIRRHAVRASRHAVCGLEAQGYPFAVGQGLPFQGGRLGRNRRLQDAQKDKDSEKEFLIKTECYTVWIHNHSIFRFLSFSISVVRLMPSNSAA